jgi:murein DD-endopeptidase MepM/ murein hydrolase activator NlpD
MKKLIIPCLMIILSAQLSEAADWSQEYCSGDKGVCMSYEQNGNRMDVYLRNKFPVKGMITTVTLVREGNSKNMKTGNSFPMTMVCSGDKRVRAASFTIIDTTKEWNPGLNWYWCYGSYTEGTEKNYVYSLPYKNGKRFRVCQAFNDTPTHHGDFAYSIDWIMPEGTPVCAVRPGLVFSVVDTHSGGGFKEEYKNKNNIIQILHDDGTFAYYAHIQTNSAIVKEGQRVNQGDVIALSGNVGYSQNPHLHFSIFKPQSGRVTGTIPFGFVTDYSDYEILEKGAFYTFTGRTPKEEKPLVDIDDVVICKDIINDIPVYKGDSFLPGDKIRVYVPLYAVKNHTVQISLIKKNSTVPARKSAWMMKKGNWYTYMDADLSGIADSPGEWRAEIVIDKKIIGSKNFIIKNSP